MKHPILFLFTFFCAFTSNFAQNETQKWYFGQNAGLDFSTNPPTVLTNGAMSTAEGCSSICDANGSLLFYTDGITVYNQNHVAMSNGTGLFGSGSTSQSGVIVKKPGSNSIFFVFTLTSGFGSLCYSEVDMSLSGGLGAVTANKNVPVAQNLTEHLTSVKHGNGSDIWVVAHDGNGSSTFRAFLVSAVGVNTVAVTSTAGTSLANYFIGCMKFSPDGSKLGLALGGSNLVELFDFNPFSGTISNPLSLNPSGTVGYPYGVEFSPDGTKFYCKGNNFLAQWDLCAGNNSLIVSSISTFTTNVPIGSLQLASNGKIYVACSSTQSLGVINNPNMAGSSCNYVYGGLSIAPKYSQAGLPNFITTYYKPTPAPFTYSVDCQVVAFTATPSTAPLPGGCAPSTNTPSSIYWLFGESASGTNTSTLLNPSHQYSAPGTYTVKLVLNYPNSVDTLKQNVAVLSFPTLSVSGAFTICSGSKKTYTASGANSYTWSSGPNSSTVSLSPQSQTVYTVSGVGPNSCKASKAFTVYVAPCTSIERDELREGSTRIYPNPTDGPLFLELVQPMEFLLYNTLGKLLMGISLSQGNHTIDLSPYQSGVYTLKLFGSSATKTFRLVKTD